MDGIINSLKLEQPQKALDPILVTVDGIVTEDTFEVENAFEGISVISSSKITAQVQFEKALDPIVVTVAGIVISVKPVQLLKAEDPILVTPDGIVISVKLVQLLKAQDPILVTLEGIVTEVIRFAPDNAMISVRD